MQDPTNNSVKNKISKIRCLINQKDSKVIQINQFAGGKEKKKRDLLWNELSTISVSCNPNQSNSKLNRRVA